MCESNCESDRNNHLHGYRIIGSGLYENSCRYRNGESQPNRYHHSLIAQLLYGRKHRTHGKRSIHLFMDTGNGLELHHLRQSDRITYRYNHLYRNGNFRWMYRHCGSNSDREPESHGNDHSFVTIVLHGRKHGAYCERCIDLLVVACDRIKLHHLRQPDRIAYRNNYLYRNRDFRCRLYQHCGSNGDREPQSYRNDHSRFTQLLCRWKCESIRKRGIHLFVVAFNWVILHYVRQSHCEPYGHDHLHRYRHIRQQLHEYGNRYRYGESFAERIRHTFIGHHLQRGQRNTHRLGRSFLFVDTGNRPELHHLRESYREPDNEHNIHGDGNRCELLHGHGHSCDYSDLIHRGNSQRHSSRDLHRGQHHAERGGGNGLYLDAFRKFELLHLPEPDRLANINYHLHGYGIERLVPYGNGNGDGNGEPAPCHHGHSAFGNHLHRAAGGCNIYRWNNLHLDPDSRRK